MTYTVSGGTLNPTHSLTLVCFWLQFLLIFRKALAGELTEDSGLYDLYRLVTEIDVQKEGVKGAKNFFEAKVRLHKLSNTKKRTQSFLSVLDSVHQLYTVRIQLM